MSIKILLIEDNPADARFVRELLGEANPAYQYEIAHSERLDRALEVLKTDKFDVILLDLSLPDAQGLDSVGKINAAMSEMPIVIMSGLSDEDTAVRAVQKGAQEYLVKGHVDSYLLARSIRYAIERKRSEKLIENIVKSLEIANAELSMLYKVSSAINRSINLDELFNDILQVISEVGLPGIGNSMGIFIVEGDKMSLAAHLGHSDDFLRLHTDLKVGDCLCGLAAETGEIITSKNSGTDSRHTINYPGIIPHGHIIIPLKARNRILGVLYLYLSADCEPGREEMNILVSIAEMAGVAINNAKLYEETKKLSLHDPLTGLANRRYMDIIFERISARAIRYGGTFSVVMLDIDHFKKYNDTCGHKAGDKLLVNISNIISKEVRGIDLVVRYGGEEFLVLFPETGMEMAYEVAERIRKNVAENAGVTISLGVSSYHQGLGKDDIINKADAALYQAKRKGRNMTVISEQTVSSCHSGFIPE